MRTGISALLLVTLLFLSCNLPKNKQISALQYVPKDAAILLKINDLDKLKSDIQNNELLSTNTHLDLVNYFETLPQFELHPQAKTQLLCLSPLGKKDFEYTFITRFDPRQLAQDSLSAKKITKETYSNTTFYKIASPRDPKPYFALQIDSLLIATSSKLLLENAVRRQQSIKEKNHAIPDGLQKAYDVASTDQALALIVHGKALQNAGKRLLPNAGFEFLSGFESWITADALVTQTELRLDGIVMLQDSIPSIPGLFRHTLAQTNALPEITPTTAKGLTSYTYDDFEILKKNLATYQDRPIKEVPDSLDALLMGASEIGTISLAENKLVAIHLIDESVDTETLIAQNQKTNTYQNVAIFRFEHPKLLSDILRPLIPEVKANYFTILDTFVIFGAQLSALQNIIANYKNKSVYAKAPNYQQLSQQLSDQSSVLVMGQVSHIAKAIAQGVDKEHESDWKKLNHKNYSLAAMQLVNETKFAHLHLVTQKNNGKKTAQSISQIASTTLSNKISSTPQLLKNHRSKGMDIAIQDDHHNLYLISNQGNIFWKKPLDGPILGKISQIDIYKNGRLQLLFNTSKTLYLLDRNGKDVAPYPKKFDNTITQPLAVFDYDRNKQYRIVVTQGKTLTMYEANGKVVKGFDFKGTESALILPPKHFRLGSKDYLLLAEENGKLSILDRVGRDRIRVQKSFNFSGNPWFGYKNTFVSTTAEGDLVTISRQGKVSTKNMNLNNDHGLTATSKTLVTLSENKLTIKGKTITLDYGNYSDPQIFYLRDKIYVTVTDLEAKKVYLFDSKGKMLPNFPVYGQSMMALGHMDKDAYLEFVVQGEDNSVLLYQMN